MDKQREIEQITNMIYTTKNPIVVANGVPCIQAKAIAEHLVELKIGDKDSALFEFTDIVEKSWRNDIEELKDTRSRIKNDPELVSHYTQLIVAIERSIEDMNNQLYLYMNDK